MFRSKLTRRLFTAGIAVALVGAAIAVGLYRTSHPKSARLAGDTAANDAELERLKSAVDAAPSDKLAKWNLAAYYLNKNSLQQCEATLKEIIKLDPTDIRARDSLGDVYLKLQRYSAGEAVYRLVLEKSADDVPALQGLCAALVREHRYYESMNAGRRLLKVDKDNPGSRLLCATATLDFALQFKDPLTHASDILAAQSELKSLTAQMPDSGDVYYQLGRAAMALLHRSDAVSNLERAHQLLPNSIPAARSLAVAYRAMNRNDAAITLMQEMAAKLPGSAPINDMLGLALMDSQDPTAHRRALQAFANAFKTNPNDATICSHLADASLSAQNLKAARLAYERSIRLDPYQSYAFQKLALVYTRIGEPELAKKAADLAQKMTFNEQQLATLLELSSKHPDDVALRLIIAERYRDTNKQELAREQYLEIWKLDPGNKRVPKQYTGAASSQY